MSTPNPLIPQGTLQAKGARGASNIRIAVATIVAIHVVFFGGLLLQGCKRDTKTMAGQTNAPAETNLALALPPMDTSSTSMYYTNASSLPAESSNRYAGTPAGGNTAAPLQPANTPQDIWTQGGAAPGIGVETGATKDYTVKPGDSLSRIAKSNHVSVAALQKANPNVDASKLHVGTKIKIPVKESSAVATGDSGVASAGTGDGKVYTVKPGDTLSRIARQHGVTAGAIRTANNMKTTRVNVGQKLKIPAGGEAAPATKSASTKSSSTVSTNATF